MKLVLVGLFTLQSLAFARDYARQFSSYDACGRSEVGNAMPACCQSDLIGPETPGCNSRKLEPLCVRLRAQFELKTYAVMDSRPLNREQFVAFCGSGREPACCNMGASFGSGVWSCEAAIAELEERPGDWAR
ncbi:unnamed protein product [Cercospora beticola]|nr:unnamed protein product [Cercospora beticola]